MIRRIIEVGVVVRDLTTAGNKFCEILGAERGNALDAIEYGMVAQFFRLGNIEFELMKPIDEDGIIAKFLRKRGEGLHHLAFEVSNLDRVLERMRFHNIRLIDEKVISMGDIKAAFLSPESFGGVLLELIEGTPRNVQDLELPIEFQTQVQGVGLWVEGILEVGISVKDLESMSRFYGIAFSSTTSKIVYMKPSSLKLATCAVRNVSLSLMELINYGKRSEALFRKGQTGLNHVTLKVTNIQNAIDHLKSKKVNFSKDPLELHDSISVLIHPEEICGVPILLKESTNPLMKNSL